MAKEETIEVKPLKIGVLKVRVIGKSPYLPEPMDMSVVELYDKKKSKQVYEKDTRSEMDKVKEKYYLTEDGKKGIPARAFYKAMVRASTYLIEKKSGGMRVIREGILIRGDVLPMKFKKETIRKDWGKSSGMTGAPRLIVRNAFHDWSVDLEIEYNTSQLSAELIYNVLNWAGFHIGVGGWRKECEGNFGAFHVEPIK